MHLLVLWLMLALLTTGIASGELTCSITTTSNGTFYKVPDFGKYNCGPQWIDADNNILANSDGKNDSLVVASNITTLHTYDCHNAVMYVLDCYPLPWLNRKVTCFTNCSESAGVSVRPGNTEGTSNHWVIPVICTIMAFFCVFCGMIYYYRRQRSSRNGL